jgi:hypothetical protein
MEVNSRSIKKMLVKKYSDCWLGSVVDLAGTKDGFSDVPLRGMLCY